MLDGILLYVEERLERRRGVVAATCVKIRRQSPPLKKSRGLVNSQGSAKEGEGFAQCSTNAHGRPTRSTKSCVRRARRVGAASRVLLKGPLLPQSPVSNPISAVSTEAAASNGDNAQKRIDMCPKCVRGLVKGPHGYHSVDVASRGKHGRQQQSRQQHRRQQNERRLQ